MRRKEEKERIVKEEEEYEQKMLERKRIERERAFKDVSQFCIVVI